MQLDTVDSILEFMEKRKPHGKFSVLGVEIRWRWDWGVIYEYTLDEVGLILSSKFHSHNTSEKELAWKSLFENTPKFMMDLHDKFWLTLESEGAWRI